MQIYLGCKQLISFCYGVITQPHSQTPSVLGMSLILSMAWVQSYIGICLLDSFYLLTYRFGSKKR